MLVRYHRLAFAGVVIAAAIAVPTAALASGSGSPAGKPAPSQAAAASAKKQAAAASAKKQAAAASAKKQASAVGAKKPEAQSQLPALAASAGISVNRLQVGLAAAKRAGGNTPASITAFAASAGVPHATAQRVVYAVFGTKVIRSVASK